MQCHYDNGMRVTEQYKTIVWDRFVLIKVAVSSILPIKAIQNKNNEEQIDRNC